MVVLLTLNCPLKCKHGKRRKDYVFRLVSLFPVGLLFLLGVTPHHILIESISIGHSIFFRPSISEYRIRLIRIFRRVLAENSSDRFVYIQAVRPRCHLDSAVFILCSSIHSFRIWFHLSRIHMPEFFFADSEVKCFRQPHFIYKLCI